MHLQSTIEAFDGRVAGPCRPPAPGARPGFRLLISACPGYLSWAPTLLPFFCLAILTLSGCAAPKRLNEVSDYRERLETQSRGGITVTSTTLSPRETEAEFQLDLAKKGVQPIWLEIENRGTQDLHILFLSIDPDYFSPSEVAWMYRSHLHLDYEEIVDRFLAHLISPVVPAGETVSGFVYTNLDPGAKAYSVELWAEGRRESFDFVHLVPGFEADFQVVDFESLYEARDKSELDLDGLRSYIDSLPCCVTGPDKQTPGDPLNLVVISEARHLLATFVRRGWDLTETMRRDTVWRTAASSVFRFAYRTSPVSELFVFDRPQDIALQKTRANVDERNHLRLWLSPVSYEGKSVWVGQISRDIGVKLSRKTVVTHKIDPIVDEARFYVTQDLAASRQLQAMGYTGGVGISTRADPRYNYTQDPYYTDGLRVVLILDEARRPLQQIDVLDWVQPEFEDRPEVLKEPGPEARPELRREAYSGTDR